MSAATKPWFEVDRAGMAKLIERRGKAFVLYELLQNAFDTRARRVDVMLEADDRPGYSLLCVVDDHPEGWKDLTHAWTLFAESEKKADPEKRGRFNLGEKLVLALCREATISTTKGTVTFTSRGRKVGRAFRLNGSEFRASIRMSKEERLEVLRGAELILPPDTIEVTVNGQRLQKARLRTIENVLLQTEIADEEGVLRRRPRRTWVEVVEPVAGGAGWLYEMGIPVVETGDRWSYNVGQKIPLNADRDNVQPNYLRDVRAAVLNAMHASLQEEDATRAWVRDAAGDANATKQAVERVLTLRFGEKRVVADPSDPEGTKLAVAKGYTVIQPGALSGDEWRNAKHYKAVLPAGQVTPSPKPFSPDGRPLKLVPVWTAAQAAVARYCERLGLRLLGRDVQVKIASDMGWPYVAAYGNGTLYLNFARLGTAWFEKPEREKVHELLIHEFAHETTGDHLSHEFHKATCALGAKLAALAIYEPDLVNSLWGASA